MTPRRSAGSGAVTCAASSGQHGCGVRGGALRRGLRAFAGARLRLRLVLRQGRLTTLTEIACGTEGWAGSLSVLFLDVPGEGTRTPEGSRVELVGAEVAALPWLVVRHVPGAQGAVPPRRAPSTPPGQTARTLVLRGWGAALPRPFVDAWVQDEHGWVRPSTHGDGSTTWTPVGGHVLAADLAAVLPERLGVPARPGEPPAEGGAGG